MDPDGDAPVDELFRRLVDVVHLRKLDNAALCAAAHLWTGVSVGCWANRAGAPALLRRGPPLCNAPPLSATHGAGNVERAASGVARRQDKVFQLGKVVVVGVDPCLERLCRGHVKLRALWKRGGAGWAVRRRKGGARPTTEAAARWRVVRCALCLPMRALLAEALGVARLAPRSCSMDWIWRAVGRINDARMAEPCCREFKGRAAPATMRHTSSSSS